ncbi:very-long-chain (3R)-3-hydroxyacyl-CoA dehydratase 4 isoform X2 [Oryzias melastigma]|uniref:very-long-chain (3R)-3-hydroxyacyl-CoA dehydratase 4 isoform X2 n=1 Tax=Oryzias melastigma TaxID=30732 RepID=UPI00168CFC28|nr:very-long-chain (3R)-3-hydroxyacyl-CoA dehydratase 4 isoform X2 [Oryzias melastigma]
MSCFSDLQWKILGKTSEEYALADTFYSVGFVMSLCQLLSVLELFHIADGIEKARLLPRFVQVMEKNILLIVVTMCEDIQREPVVCVQFFLWNILDLLRYPHELLCVVATPSITMLQTRYSLWIPLYTLSVINEGAVINRALTFTEPAALTCPHFQISLSSMIYLPVLAIGAGMTVWQLLKERRYHLDRWNKRRKRK